MLVRVLTLMMHFFYLVRAAAFEAALGWRSVERIRAQPSATHPERPTLGVDKSLPRPPLDGTAVQGGPLRSLMTSHDEEGDSDGDVLGSEGDELEGDTCIQLK